MNPPWTLGHVPVAPFMTPRGAVAPGISPLDPAEWLLFAEDHAGQMAERDRLIAEAPDDVLAMVPRGEAAALELLEALAEEVVARHGHRRTGPRTIQRPDGAEVDLDALPPIAAAGRLVQDDLLIMEKAEDEAEHVLTAGVLCFPAHWTLSEKIGRPLLRIHKPVPEYPGDLERRVQRFFDGVRPGRPLIRANWHFAGSPEIITPMREAEKMGAFVSRLAPGDQAWLRVERQTVLRLPRSGAAVFGVRTIMSPVSALTKEQWKGLHDTLRTLPEEVQLRKLSPALRERAAREAAG